ncbi:hypothetical protein ABGB14_44975 [Nonomuraea sp. B10E15]|uniref:hypothetical protein n=1 Tax=Nonomuraea sp. B10E15 TaxID=3153560 RepID=UPI00325E8DE4
MRSDAWNRCWWALIRPGTASRPVPSMIRSAAPVVRFEERSAPTRRTIRPWT